MADIRVVSTGREFRRIDNGTALLLEEMFPAALERINDAPKTVHPDNARNTAIVNHAAPEWSVGKSPYGLPAIFLRTGRDSLTYLGPPDDARGYFQHKRVEDVPVISPEGWPTTERREYVTGHEVPQEIVEQYQRLLVAPEPRAASANFMPGDQYQR